MILLKVHFESAEIINNSHPIERFYMWNVVIPYFLHVSDVCIESSNSRLSHDLKHGPEVPLKTGAFIVYLYNWLEM